MLGVNSPSNILLLPRLVVEYPVFSLFLIPESYSGISVMVLPLSVHAEYPCVPLTYQVLSVNLPSNILLLPRLVVEYSMQSLSISPESYSGIHASKP